MTDSFLDDIINTSKGKREKINMIYYIVDAEGRLVTTDCDELIATAVAEALGGYCYSKPLATKSN